jgi:hypothetical protein
MTTTTLADVLGYLRNWFVCGMTSGTFAIDGGELDAPELELQDGQYIRIVGSVFNDGLHVANDDTLTDETFTGTVYALAIPADILALVEDIEAYRDATETAGAPVVAESFDGYSYKLATNHDGNILSWVDRFRSRLNRWRKI